MIKKRIGGRYIGRREQRFLKRLEKRQEKRSGIGGKKKPGGFHRKWWKKDNRRKPRRRRLRVLVRKITKPRYNSLGLLIPDKDLSKGSNFAVNFIVRVKRIKSKNLIPLYSLCIVCAIIFQVFLF